MDPGLQFWLRYVDDHGGLTEPVMDGTLVVLPPAVAAEFDLPDELMVTSDPDVAREDGMVLLTTGHPVLIRAADATLTGGDAGMVALAAPSIPAPGIDYLQDRAREQFPVEHGRIDVTGLPTRVTRPVLRVGALVTYTVSAEECYQERLECWVDAQAAARPARQRCWRFARLAAHRRWCSGGVRAPPTRRRGQPATEHPLRPGIGRS
jgi:hypothetical protein